jgi:hypothetical protein
VPWPGRCRPICSRFFGSGFKAHVEEIHHEAAGDDRLREIINFDYFASLVASYPNLSLVNSKRLMVYLIFLIWYRHHFRRA